MKISNKKTLQESMIELEIKRDLLLLEMKELVHETKESLKPSNLIKDTIGNFSNSESPGFKISNGLLGIGAGFLAKKLLFRSNKGFVHKLLGNALQLIVTNYVARKKQIIKTYITKKNKIIMKPNIGITDKNLSSINDILNKVLADGNVLYIKLRKFHWNLGGDNFMELHLLFEAQYTEVAEAVDSVAERISTLGGIAIGTTGEFAKLSQLKENPGKIPTNLLMIKELVEDHESIIKALRKFVDETEEKLKDKGTSDFLTALMQAHEKMAWKLRKYIKEAK